MNSVDRRRLALNAGCSAKPETNGMYPVSRPISSSSVRGPGLSPVTLLAGARWLRTLRHQTTRSGRNKSRARARRETALILGGDFHPPLPQTAYGSGSNLAHYCLTIDRRAAAGPAQVGQQRRETPHCGQDTDGPRYGRREHTRVETVGSDTALPWGSQAGQAGGVSASDSQRNLDHEFYHRASTSKERHQCLFSLHKLSGQSAQGNFAR